MGWVIAGVWAGRVLNPAEVSLHPHAHRVVGVGQLQALGVVVVEGEHLARDPGEVLQTSITSWVDNQNS